MNLGKWMILMGLLTWMLWSAVGASSTPSINGKIVAGEYANTFKHAESGIVLNWSIVGNTIYFGIESSSKGWTGIGFNPIGDRKEGADMYQWFMENGKLSIRDAVMTKNKGFPRTDTDEGGKNDILASAGSETPNGTVAEFSRKLDTGDKTDQPILVGKVTKLLLAVGDTANFTKNHSPSTRWQLELIFK
jgi:hypothetical protein